MKCIGVLLLVVLAVLAVLAEDPTEENREGTGVSGIPDRNCLIHYECKHYKWFCYRSEYAFCIDNKCKCMPRYHFGYRHPYRHLRP